MFLKERIHLICLIIYTKLVSNLTFVDDSSTPEFDL